MHLQKDLHTYSIHAVRCLQKDMLEDHKRTGAYYQAVMQNRRQFEGKVVLDVGTGSGILAIFAAKAGARKVYAVEATPMAKFAQSLVEHNGVSPTPLAAFQTGLPTTAGHASGSCTSDSDRAGCHFGSRQHGPPSSIIGKGARSVL